MKGKLKAASQLQQLAEQQRDRQSKLFAQQQQQSEHYQRQLDALQQLKSGCQSGGRPGKMSLSSSTLQNNATVQSQLSRLLNHHQHEKAVMDARCRQSQIQLEQSHARVKGLEVVIERWQAKQRFEEARKAQRQLEELINTRYRRKPR